MTRYTKYKKTHLKASQFKFQPGGTETKDGSPLVSEPSTKKQRKNSARSKMNNTNGVLKARPIKVCFACRKPGHLVEQCTNNVDGSAQPETDQPATFMTGICYHCASLQHTSKHCSHPNRKKHPFKFATCFICQQQGHLASQCPANEHGLYPNGGSCNFCGSIRHLAKDCKPEVTQDKEPNALGTTNLGQGGDDEVFYEHDVQKLEAQPEKVESKVRKPKVVSF